MTDTLFYIFLFLIPIYYLFNSYFHLKNPSVDSYFDIRQHKVIMISGCNSGIGLATLKKMIQASLEQNDSGKSGTQNPLFIMIVRSQQKADQTLEMISKELKLDIELLRKWCKFLSPVDFVDFRSIQKFIDEFAKLNLQCDVLINK